ncbi:hypothetical protein HID58_039337, partial [Brassica napus]
SLAQSREIVSNVKSSKLNERIIYDCVDIYKQPSLSHPLLKNHKIQCPNGTVPILKNTKKYVANAQYWAERHFNPLTDESPGKHVSLMNYLSYKWKSRDKCFHLIKK